MSVNMDDLCELDKRTRRLVSNRTCVSAEKDRVTAVQLRGLWFYKGYADSDISHAHATMAKWKHFAEVAVLFPQDDETIEKRFDKFAQKFGIVRKNKTFLLNVYVKALSSSPYVDEIRKTYLYNKNVYSLSQRLIANTNPVLGLFMKSWKEFKALYADAGEALITEDEKFNAWSQLVTRLMKAHEQESFDEFLSSVEGRMLCNRVTALKRYVYRYVQYASTIGDTEKLKLYVRSRLEFCARLEEILRSQVFQPVVIELNGDAGVGKSHNIHILAKHFARLLGMNENDVVYSRPSAAKYWTGYCGQPIVLYDDFNQDPKVDELNELIHVASGVPFEVPCADIVDKGILFTSDLVILTTNEKVENMNHTKIKCKEALLRRINHSLDCKVKPACAKLVGTKLQFKGGLNASRLYRGRYEFDSYGFASWCEFLLRENFLRQNIQYHDEPEEFEFESNLDEMMNMDFDPEIDGFSDDESFDLGLIEPEPVVTRDVSEGEALVKRAKAMLGTNTPVRDHPTMDVDQLLAMTCEEINQMCVEHQAQTSNRLKDGDTTLFSFRGDLGQVTKRVYHLGRATAYSRFGFLDKYTLEAIQSFYGLKSWKLLHKIHCESIAVAGFKRDYVLNKTQFTRYYGMEPVFLLNKDDDHTLVPILQK